MPDVGVVSTGANGDPIRCSSRATCMQAVEELAQGGVQASQARAKSIDVPRENSDAFAVCWLAAHQLDDMRLKAGW